MKVSLKAIVQNLFTSDKTGKTYYDFIDLDNGSPVKMTFDGQLQGVKPGSQLVIDAEVKTRIGKDGGVYMNHVGGSVKPL